MTQEEKARAYDEVREKIAIRFGSNVAKEIFSEYEESEDEKIRKEMISWLKGFIGEEEGCGYTEDEIRERIALLEKQSEQKPAWSEDDERIYKVIVELLNSWSNGTIGGCIIPPNTDRYINWLKSLKDSCLPQPKQEWSDADEEELELATGTLLNAGQSSSAQWVEDLSERLKSLRPQKQWKPSDEQMKALYEETQKSDRIRDVRIVSLYEDLKKLMEE